MERILYLPDGEAITIGIRPDVSSTPYQNPSAASQALFREATELLKRAAKVTQDATVSKYEAVWKPTLNYPKVPMAILMATDIHYGSIHTDYDMLMSHLDIVEQTPNFYLISNGDDVDNFNVTGKWATGVYENPLPPQLQTQAMIQKYEYLDKIGKLGLMSFGNHNDGIFSAGYDWFDTWARNIKAPIFGSGGFLHVMPGQEHYGVAVAHRYWGASKLNPTNATKRMWEHEYPQADVVFLGHTHQSEVLQWERGGKERVSFIGGTYKLVDTYARKRGIGGRGGMPGQVLLLYPDRHQMVGLKDINIAKDFILRSVSK